MFYKGINALGEWLDDHFPRWQVHFQKKGVAYKIFAWIYGEEELQGTFCQGFWRALGKLLSGVGNGFEKVADSQNRLSRWSMRALQLTYFLLALASLASIVVIAVQDFWQTLVGLAVVLGMVIFLGAVVGLIAFASKHLCPIRFTVKEERV